MPEVGELCPLCDLLAEGRCDGMQDRCINSSAAAFVSFTRREAVK